MKKAVLFILLFFLFTTNVFAEVTTFSENNKFGLKDEKGTVAVKAKYKKLVRLGKSSWIMQDGTKFGIISDNGEISVKPIYNQAERILGKYVKFRKGSKYCLLNEDGFDIIGKDDKKIQMFSSIDLLYGGLIVTSKNYKYGLHSFDGNIEIEEKFDDIYMQDKDTLVFIYGDKKLEFKRLEQNNTNAPFDFIFANLKDADLKLSDLTNSPLATTGYYSVTLTDYILKTFASISPAYEQTIDELMFSQGADTVSVLIKCTWLPKFPFVYAKNYYNVVKNPSNGPLNKAKKNLRKHIKE